MSDNDDRDSGKIGSFLLGFLCGVLVCLGAGGTFFAVYWQRGAMQAERAMMVAEQARAEAEMARQMAERERERALQAVEAEKKAKAKE